MVVVVWKAERLVKREGKKPTNKHRKRKHEDPTIGCNVKAEKKKRQKRNAVIKK